LKRRLETGDVRLEEIATSPSSLCALTTSGSKKVWGMKPGA
jgi:hypothetical protein